MRLSLTISFNLRGFRSSVWGECARALFFTWLFPSWSCVCHRRIRFIFCDCNARDNNSLDLDEMKSIENSRHVAYSTTHACRVVVTASLNKRSVADVVLVQRHFARFNSFQRKHVNLFSLLTDFNNDVLITRWSVFFAWAATHLETTRKSEQKIQLNRLYFNELEKQMNERTNVGRPIERNMNQNFHFDLENLLCIDRSPKCIDRFEVNTRRLAFFDAIKWFNANEWRREKEQQVK